MKKINLFSALKKMTSIVLAAAAMCSILTLTGCSNSTSPIVSNISPDSSTVSKNSKKRDIKKPEDMTEDDFNDFYQVAVNKLDERIKELLDEDEAPSADKKAVKKSDIMYSLENIDLTTTIPLFYNQIKIKNIENVKLLSAYMFADMNSDFKHIHSGFHCDKYFIVLLFSSDISAEGIIEKIPGNNDIQSAEGQYVFSVYLGSPNYVDDELNYKTHMSSYSQEMVFEGGASEEEALEVWNEKVKYDDECQYTHTKIK